MRLTVTHNSRRFDYANDGCARLGKYKICYDPSWSSPLISEVYLFLAVILCVYRVV